MAYCVNGANVARADGNFCEGCGSPLHPTESCRRQPRFPLAFNLPQAQAQRFRRNEREERTWSGSPRIAVSIGGLIHRGSAWRALGRNNPGHGVSPSALG
jgi:hypothetical protein